MKTISFKAPRNFCYDIYEFLLLKNIMFGVSVQIFLPHFFEAVQDLIDRTGRGWKSDFAPKLFASSREQILDFLRTLELDLEGFDLTNKFNILALKQYLMNFPHIQEAAREISIIRWDKAMRYKKGKDDIVFQSFEYLVDDDLYRRIGEVAPDVVNEFTYHSMICGIKNVQAALDCLLLHQNTPSINNSLGDVESIKGNILEQLSNSPAYFSEHGIETDQIDRNNAFDLIAANLYCREIDTWKEFLALLEETHPEAKKIAFKCFYRSYPTYSVKDIIHQWVYRIFEKNSIYKIHEDRLMSVAAKMNRMSFKKILLINCDEIDEKLREIVDDWKHSEMGAFIIKYLKLEL